MVQAMTRSGVHARGSRVYLYVRYGRCVACFFPVGECCVVLCGVVVLDLRDLNLDMRSNIAKHDTCAGCICSEQVYMLCTYSAFLKLFGLRNE